MEGSGWPPSCPCRPARAQKAREAGAPAAAGLCLRPSAASGIAVSPSCPQSAAPRVLQALTRTTIDTSLRCARRHVLELFRAVCPNSQQEVFPDGSIAVNDEALIPGTCVTERGTRPPVASYWVCKELIPGRLPGAAPTLPCSCFYGAPLRARPSLGALGGDTGISPLGRRSGCFGPFLQWAPTSPKSC